MTSPAISLAPVPEQHLGEDDLESMDLDGSNKNESLVFESRDTGSLPEPPKDEPAVTTYHAVAARVQHEGWDAHNV